MVGTHAVLQDDVCFQRLGLAIINPLTVVLANADLPYVYQHLLPADEDLFRHAIGYLDRRAQEGAPFFSMIMSTSNHKPYTFPPGIPGLPERGFWSFRMIFWSCWSNPPTGWPISPLKSDCTDSGSGSYTSTAGALTSGP